MEEKCEAKFCYCGGVHKSTYIEIMARFW